MFKKQYSGIRFFVLVLLYKINSKSVKYFKGEIVNDEYIDYGKFTRNLVIPEKDEKIGSCSFSGFTIITINYSKFISTNVAFFVYIKI